MEDYYNYRALQSGQIRLLKIQFAFDGSVYEINHIQLSDNLELKCDNFEEPQRATRFFAAHQRCRFSALSYIWDNQTPEHDIRIWDRINAKESILKVTRNINTVLPILTSKYPETSWWIDALCINQTNIAELGNKLDISVKWGSRSSRKRQALRIETDSA